MRSIRADREIGMSDRVGTDGCQLNADPRSWSLWGFASDPTNVGNKFVEDPVDLCHPHEKDEMMSPDASLTSASSIVRDGAR
jgi:hypothetical protein